MDARDEQRSLADNPLPPEQLVRVPEDDTLPTRIYEIDHLIANLESALALARETRQELLDRAVTLEVYKDESTGIYITKKERNLPREVNKDLLKEKKPTIYEAARSIEIANATEKIQNQIDALKTSNPPIRIKTLQALMSEAEIDEICFPHRVSVTWEVKKKRSTTAALSKGEQG